MPEQPVVHIGENSPEYVAYRIALDVLLKAETLNWDRIDRKTYLDTYAECLAAVRGRRRWKD